MGNFTKNPGPLCAETNKPKAVTPGSWGRNDCADPNNPTVLEMVAGPAGVQSVTWQVASSFTKVLPSGLVIEKVIAHLLDSIDQQDLVAAKRIINHIKRNPDAALKNLYALCSSALSAANSEITGDHLISLQKRLAAAQWLLPPLAVGCVVGALESLWDTLKQLYGMVAHTDEFVDDILGILEILLSADGENICKDIGNSAGASVAADVKKIADSNVIVAVYEIGKIIGPTVVAILLAALTSGAGGAAAASGRMATILAKFKRLRGASRLLDRISRRRKRKLLPDLSDDEISKAFEALKIPKYKGRKQPKIEGRRIPIKRNRRLDANEIPRLQGESLRDAIRRIKTVIGHRIDGQSSVQSAWNKAKQKILNQHSLTRDNARELYEKTRDEFWRNVRDNPSAKAHFENAGFEFPPRREYAPLLKEVPDDISANEVRISLDHVNEIAQGQNWQKALDADNLEFMFQMPNSWREIVQMRHPDLR